MSPIDRTELPLKVRKDLDLIVRLCMRLQPPDEALDRLVSVGKEVEASQLNEEGFEAQIHYLLEGTGLTPLLIIDTLRAAALKQRAASTMKVYLDDVRVAPDGWVQCLWPDEVIELLKTGNVEALSLDHDLGDDQRGTGLTVLNWLEEQVMTGDFKPPRIRIHSDNAAAISKMDLIARRIHEAATRRDYLKPSLINQAKARRGA